MTLKTIAFIFGVCTIVALCIIAINYNFEEINHREDLCKKQNMTYELPTNVNPAHCRPLEPWEVKT